MDPDFDEFVSADTTALYLSSTGSKTVGHLLWGDGVRHLSGGAQNGRTNVRARGRAGWVDPDALGGRSLLEFYFIDVGQGDGTLIKTPDFRHILIDGGYPRAAQPTRKSAADFVDWKFFNDYGSKVITLDAMIASHNDFDHYGGLADLLDVEQNDELDAQTVTVERFYHAGVSWWRKPRSGGAPGFNGRWLGEVRNTDGTTWLVQLLGDRVHAVSALDTAAAQQLQGAWAEFIAKVVETKTGSGGPTPIVRLGRDPASIAAEEPQFLPGFAAADGDVRIHVLAPVPRAVGGQPALRRLTADQAQNTNGHSVLLRVDYGRTRTLLTGDLNKRAQHTLLEDYAGQRLAFKCDVAKACHHGSEDVSFEFLQAMEAGATIISSGDGEGHDHPRPRVVAASGVTGHLTIADDEIQTPLVYATELARSVSFGDPFRLILDPLTTTPETLDGARFEGGDLHFTTRPPGALNPERKKRRMQTTDVVAGLVYGLVNVRTDGDRLLCATMDEKEGSFAVKSFRSRF
jgi:beta-lactamase superfamily II metal-dependent hydrolase